MSLTLLTTAPTRRSGPSRGFGSIHSGFHLLPRTSRMRTQWKCSQRARFSGQELDDASELKAAGLLDSISIEDVDPADFYEEPDY